MPALKMRWWVEVESLNPTPQAWPSTEHIHTRVIVIISLTFVYFKDFFLERKVKRKLQWHYINKYK